MSAIKAGDLVMVVRGSPCCGSTHAIGTAFVVDSVAIALGTCRHCGANETSLSARTGKRSERGLVACLVSRLIRIDPPALPESVETEREVVA